jgi:cell division septation protein DedD
VDDALLERSRLMPPAQAAFPGRGAVDQAEELPESGASEVVREEKPPEPEETPAAQTRVRVETERVRRSERDGTSPVVRGMLIAVVVLIVGFAGWWFLTWRSAGPETPRVTPPAQRPIASGNSGQADSLDSGAAMPAASPTELAQSTPAADPDAVEESVVENEEPASPVETSRDVEGLMAEPVENDPGMARQAEPEPPAQDPFEEGLHRVAASGWSLHWFSFVDSLEAVRSAEKIGREGYATTVRGANVKGKRWYRVLVGNFDSREAATKYRSRAQDKFGVDWVGVAKHQ